MSAKKTTLKNGLTLITVPMNDSPTVTVLVMVGAGSHYEVKKNNGVSHFLEHMCFKGTTNRPTAGDVSHELDALGSRSNAFTSQEYTGYWAKTSAKNTSAVLDIISDLYLNPLFDPEEIEREKGVIIEEINMYEDLPQYNVYELLNSLMYGNQPAGWSILGPKKNIRNMKQKDFLTYRESLYVAENTVVVVAGDITHGSIKKEVEKKFSGMPASKPIKMKKVTESQKKPQIALKYKKTDQSHFLLSFRAFNTFDKNNFALEVLAGILGRGMSSRLFHKLRNEMGVCYYVRAVTDAHHDVGALMIASGVDNRRIEEVIEAVLKEVRDLKKNEVTMKELDKAKEYIIGNMFMDLENTDDVATYYGEREIYGKEVKSPEAIAREIRKVSASDVKRVAKHIFVDKKCNLALIGPKKGKTSLTKILHV